MSPFCYSIVREGDGDANVILGQHWYGQVLFEDSPLLEWGYLSGARPHTK